MIHNKSKQKQDTTLNNKEHMSNTEPQYNSAHKQEKMLRQTNQYAFFSYVKNVPLWFECKSHIF